MQTCIYRFRTRRRLLAELDLYFNEYLFLGGIDTSSGPFCGQDAMDPSFISSTERCGDALKNIVESPGATGGRFYDGNSDHWTVDFTGVASGFFSTGIPSLTGLIPEGIDRAITVVENFLRYVLQHDVCPEYQDDIQTALGAAARARLEYPAMARFNAALPGLFNLSAGRLFANATSQDFSLLQLKLPEDYSPEIVFYTSLAALGQDIPNKGVIRQYDCVLQLCNIELPSTDIINRFRRIATGPELKPLACAPLGRATFRTTTVEDGWVDPRAADGTMNPNDVVVFLETNILKNMSIGMKLSVTLCELNTGLQFIKAVEAVYPSFYTFLPQQLMKGFKQPRIDEQPPPSIHDNGRQDLDQDQDEDQDGELSGTT